jgi:hypothetical protein
MNIPTDSLTYLDPKTFLGMTLRDYFAAMALPSIITDWYNDGLKVGDHGGADGVAMCAYMVADAMMEARKE